MYSQILLMKNESCASKVEAKKKNDERTIVCRAPIHTPRSITKRILLLGITVALFLVFTSVDSLSYNDPKSASMSRRQVLSNYGGCGGAFLVVALTTTTTCAGSSSVAHAACIPGDTSPDCIGVYKVPVDSSRDMLKANAPQLNYDKNVEPLSVPKSYQDALRVLSKQRLIANEISEAVAAGRLEEAGVKVLSMLPKLTMASRFIVSSFNNGGGTAVDGLRRSKLEGQLQELEGLWGQLDVSIGQGIRGQLGVSAAAQIRILDELKECTVALDEFQQAAASSAVAAASGVQR